MKKKLKLGILSDSHTQTTLHQEAIKHLLDNGADYLIHAGDIMLEEHLKMLEDAPVPYVCVAGNNDTRIIALALEYNLYREPYYFKIDDVTLKLMHMPYYMNSDTNIVISGHTHRFEASLQGETLFINPGEVCAREKPLSECAMVEINEGNYSVAHYFREPTLDEWSSREVLL